MTCREFTDFLDDYLYGSLAPQTRATLDAHLGECPECRTYLAGYAATRHLAKAAGNEPLPADVPEALVQAVLAAHEKA